MLTATHLKDFLDQPLPGGHIASGVVTFTTITHTLPHMSDSK